MMGLRMKIKMKMSFKRKVINKRKFSFLELTFIRLAISCQIDIKSCFAV
jgi:hypothetical protein